MTATTTAIPLVAPQPNTTKIKNDKLYCSFTAELIELKKK